MVLRSHTCVDFFGLIRRQALRDSVLDGSFHGADRTLDAAAVYGVGIVIAPFTGRLLALISG